MLPIHTVLHPTDFSERSAFALRLACALARDYGARLVLLHVATPPMAIYTEGVAPLPQDEYQEGLEEKLHRLPVPDTLHVVYRLEEGDPVTEILGVAQE